MSVQMSKRLALLVELASVVVFLQPNDLRAQKNDMSSFVASARADESTFSSLMTAPIIQAYDLSRDGHYIALLVTAGFNRESPLWLITEDIDAKRIIASREIGHFSWISNPNFPAQVRYASHERYLIVQDLKTIRVMD